MNEIGIAPSGVVTWNRQRVTDAQLEALLRQTRQLPVEPELRLVPQGTASYEVVARVMTIAQSIGVTKMDIVGNEAYAPGTAPE